MFAMASNLLIKSFFKAIIFSSHLLPDLAKSTFNRKKNSNQASIVAKLRKITALFALALVISSLTLCLYLRWFPPPTTAFMLYCHFEDLTDDFSFKKMRYQWVNNKAISPNAAAAVIASEDQRFYQHSGFDLNSIQSSIDVYMDGGKLRGASTISQQVAKNLFLTPSRSFFRKGLEVWFTFLIEMLWSKDRILEVYLNIAEFGDHIYGIEAASRHYFGHPAATLSKPQAALLAATLPNPIFLKADRPSAYVLRRQNWILRQMANLGGA
jgi:monofunctional biosynthetic peptidoglycan transglycosylase